MKLKMEDQMCGDNEKFAGRDFVRAHPLDEVVFDIIDGWFCFTLPDGGSALLDRESASNLRQALDDFLNDRVLLTPSPAYDLHATGVKEAGPPT